MKLCIAALVSAFCIPLAKACLVKKAYGPSERCHIGIPASSTTPIMCSCYREGVHERKPLSMALSRRCPTKSFGRLSVGIPCVGTPSIKIIAYTLKDSVRIWTARR